MMLVANQWLGALLGALVFLFMSGCLSCLLPFMSHHKGVRSDVL